ncbi:MAG: ribosome silencing factor [Rickettsiales bacterium]|jgi:ribosome-associated protein|nr:ribosome silencing factor [Rickettsiales bacterium]
MMLVLIILQEEKLHYRVEMSEKKLNKLEGGKFLEQLKSLITQTLDDGKAQDIKLLDVSKSTDICHYMFVATGTSSRHITSLADRIIFDIKHSGMDVEYRCEGRIEGSWVLIDCFDIIIHLFLPESREEYRIEELWA